MNEQYFGILVHISVLSSNIFKMKQLCFVEIITDNSEKTLALVTNILGDFEHLIITQTKQIKNKGNTSVINLVIDATPDELSILAGKLGGIPGVSVKSGLSKK